LFKRLPLPFEAGFLAGKAFMNYRKNLGDRKNLGNRKTPLPEFYIGAHAAISSIPFITRDKIYRIYFPTLELISPERH
jgi:predicted nucleic acid-binding protein